MDNLITSVLKKITTDYENKINAVLNNCDSPIEKVMLICLLNAFYGKNYNLDAKLEFGIEIQWLPGIDSTNEIEEKLYKLRSKKFIYDKPRLNERYSNFIIDVMVTRKISFSHDPDSDPYKDVIKKSIVIEPQFIEIVNDQFYFIDIAIFNRLKLKDGSYKIEKKLAIECDGHEFHSSKEQIKKDNARMRNLIQKEWKVIRYSGSEIYKDSKNELDNIVKEVLKIYR